MLNLKYLPAIETILQEGSITAASKKLYVSQPALSQTIKQVESELGSPIFRRGVSPIALTYEGELYLQAAQRMQDIDRSLHAQVADARSEFHGEFSLGISNQRGLQLLPRVMPEFMRLYPQVKVNLVEHGSDQLERLTLAGQCDMAFLTTTGLRGGLDYTLIENEAVVLMAAKSTALARRVPDGASIDITEARDEVFISMKPGHSVRVIQDQLFQRSGISPRILLETSNMEAAKAITPRAGAVFLLPGAYAGPGTPARAQAHCYPIRGNDFERHFYFCRRQGMYLATFQRDLVRLVCRSLNVPFTLSDDGPMPTAGAAPEPAPHHPGMDSQGGNSP